MKRPNRMWVVEWLLQNGWQPTVGAKTTRDDGRRELQDWQLRNPDDRFRLVKYVSSNAQIEARRE